MGKRKLHSRRQKHTPMRVELSSLDMRDAYKCHFPIGCSSTQSTERVLIHAKRGGVPAKLRDEEPLTASFRLTVDRFEYMYDVPQSQRYVKAPEKIVVVFAALPRMVFTS